MSPDPTVPPSTPARPSGFAPPRARSTGRARRFVAGAVAVAVIGGGVAVARRGSSSPTGYRTAEAATHRVDQVLDGVATVEPVSQATVSFPVAGTVSAVRARVGDTVSIGQSLATLDTDSLHDTLDEKRAALDQAELILEKALDGEDVSGLVRSSGSGAGAGSGAGPAGAPTLRSSAGSSTDLGTSDDLASTAGVGGAIRTVASGAGATTTRGSAGSSAGTPAGPTAAQLRAAAQAVLDAQEQVDADLASAQAALASADQVCADLGTATPTTSVPAADTTTTTAGATTTTTAAPTTPDDAISACTTALAAVQQAQAAVATSEQAVIDASAAYADLLSHAAAGVGTGGGLTASAGTGTPGQGTIPGSGSNPSSNGGGAPTGSGAGTGTTSSPSAEDLVAYQKAVDAATSQVAVAEQAIEQATIVTPIDGVIARFDLAVGDDVTAGSDTATVVIVGKGGYEVSTTVSVAKIPKVEVGQSARVTPDGSKASIAGKVVSIGIVGSTSGSTTTYPVVIGLTGDTSSLGNGATASIEIVTAASTDALAVPTSAITTDGTRHTVTVVEDGKAEEVSVEVGAVGRTWTEVKRGIDAGQEVVLADLSEPLPGSATSSSNGTTNGNRTQGPGGFTGGPPAGFIPGGARPGG